MNCFKGWCNTDHLNKAKTYVHETNLKHHQGRLKENIKFDRQKHDNVSPAWFLHLAASFDTIQTNRTVTPFSHKSLPHLLVFLQGRPPESTQPAGKDHQKDHPVYMCVWFCWNIWGLEKLFTVTRENKWRSGNSRTTYSVNNLKE